MGDVMKDPRAVEIVKDLMEQDLFGSDSSDSESDVASEAISAEMNAAMMQYMPLRGSVNFGGKVTMADVQALVDKLNALED